MLRICAKQIIELTIIIGLTLAGIHCEKNKSGYSRTNPAQLFIPPMNIRNVEYVENTLVMS